MRRAIGLAAVFFLAGCVTAPVSLVTLLEAPELYDGERMTVTAFVMETGPRGTLLVDDPNRPRKVMSLRMDRPAAIPGLHEMAVMMSEDEIREIALGVKAEFTGVIESSPENTPVFILERVNNLRWGSPASAPSSFSAPQSLWWRHATRNRGSSGVAFQRDDGTVVR